MFFMILDFTLYFSDKNIHPDFCTVHGDSDETCLKALST